MLTQNYQHKLELFIDQIHRRINTCMFVLIIYPLFLRSKAQIRLPLQIPISKYDSIEAHRVLDIQAVACANIQISLREMNYNFLKFCSW